MDGKNRNDIKAGSLVSIVLKEHQKTDERTEGHIKTILTNKKFHSRGIKVMLEEGNAVGRVQKVLKY